MKRTILALALLGFAAAPAALAETQVHELAGVSVWHPDSWAVAFDEDGDTMTIKDPSDEITITFEIMEAGDIDAALEAVDEILALIVDDLEMDEDFQTIEINGLDGIAIAGTGGVEVGDGFKIEVDIAIVLLDTADPDAVLFVFAMGASESVEEHQVSINKIFGSIRAVE